MTLLNIASDGYYNVLVAVYRALIAEGPTNKTSLIEMCSDQSDKSKARLSNTINRWTQLGLFQEDGEVVSTAPELDEYLGARKKLDQATKLLPFVVRRIVFKKENNERFWDVEKSRAADLTRAFSWLLTQNIYELDVGTHAEVASLEAQQLKDQNLKFLNNDVRFNGARTWASFLGFTWQSKAIMVDPTRAILEDLQLVFRSDKELTAETFVDRLAIILPVLDGGKYRVMLEEVLDPAIWQKPSRPEILSTSLSRSLWRLESLGRIRLASRSDTIDHRVLLRSGGRTWKPFTHVRMGQTK